MEAVHLIVAAAAVEARLADALVQVFLTVFTSKTRSAHALVTIDQVLKETNDEVTISKVKLSFNV